MGLTRRQRKIRNAKREADKRRFRLLSACDYSAPLGPPQRIATPGIFDAGGFGFGFASNSYAQAQMTAAEHKRQRRRRKRQERRDRDAQAQGMRP